MRERNAQRVLSTRCLTPVNGDVFSQRETRQNKINILFAMGTLGFFHVFLIHCSKCVQTSSRGALFSYAWHEGSHQYQLD